MSDNATDSELGRSKTSTSPLDHLFHLLGLGWEPNSPLIQKYATEKGLHRELSQWQSQQQEAARPKEVKQAKGK